MRVETKSGIRIHKPAGPAERARKIKTAWDRLTVIEESSFPHVSHPPKGLDLSRLQHERPPEHYVRAAAKLARIPDRIRRAKIRLLKESVRHVSQVNKQLSDDLEAIRQTGNEELVVEALVQRNKFLQEVQITDGIPDDLQTPTSQEPTEVFSSSGNGKAHPNGHAHFKNQGRAPTEEDKLPKRLRGASKSNTYKNAARLAIAQFKKHPDGNGIDPKALPKDVAQLVLSMNPGIALSLDGKLEGKMGEEIRCAMRDHVGQAAKAQGVPPEVVTMIYNYFETTPFPLNLPKEKLVPPFSARAETQIAEELPFIRIVDEGKRQVEIEGQVVQIRTAPQFAVLKHGITHPDDEIPPKEIRRIAHTAGSNRTDSRLHNDITDSLRTQLGKEGKDVFKLTGKTRGARYTLNARTSWSKPAPETLHSANEQKAAPPSKSANPILHAPDQSSPAQDLFAKAIIQDAPLPHRRRNGSLPEIVVFEPPLQAQQPGAEKK